jgi:2-keto-3-deoxy-6-phosphogluconate aldolase
MNDKEKKKFIPEVTTELRSDLIQMPVIIDECTGIKIFGKRVKSIIFTTDVAIALNNNADALIAVYPFTPHPAVISAISIVAQMPIFAGVGGGTTQGPRSAQMAMFAEAHGCAAVVVNAPTPLSTISDIKRVIDCPIIGTIVTQYMDIQARLNAGVSILNVSGGKNTPDIVREIRSKYPEVPIIATGGPTDETILNAIEAGANAITYTPPSNGELFRVKMDKYRQHAEDEYMENKTLT